MTQKELLSIVRTQLEAERDQKFERIDRQAAEQKAEADRNFQIKFVKAQQLLQKSTRNKVVWTEKRRAAQSARIRKALKEKKKAQK